MTVWLEMRASGNNMRELANALRHAARRICNDGEIIGELATAVYAYAFRVVNEKPEKREDSVIAVDSAIALKSKVDAMQSDLAALWGRVMALEVDLDGKIDEAAIRVAEKVIALGDRILRESMLTQPKGDPK